jgi:hypothetical protein
MQMSVFEYSSILIAIIAGQIANEVLQRMVFIMKQDGWISRYYAEMYFLSFLIVFLIGYFFNYFTIASTLEKITVFNFIGPCTSFCILYFVVSFAPIPHPRENNTDIETYFAVNVPKFCLPLGAFSLLHQFLMLTLEPNLTSSTTFWTPIYWSLIAIVSGPLVKRFIDKFGIRLFKILVIPSHIGFAVIVFIQNPNLTLTQ